MMGDLNQGTKAVSPSYLLFFPYWGLGGMALQGLLGCCLHIQFPTSLRNLLTVQDSTDDGLQK